jgi:predicted RNA-binding protein with RPS1 domain
VSASVCALVLLALFFVSMKKVLLTDDSQIILLGKDNGKQILSRNMGGEAAKERRRLKRLQESDGAASLTITPISSAKIEHSHIQPRGGGNSSGTDAARIRLQRKLARKASGKFKPQAQIEKSSLNPKSSDRRKLDDMEDNFSEAKRPSTRMPTGNPKDRLSGRIRPTNRKPASIYTKGIQAAKKEKHHTDKKKPKHLKRKMEHLSKAFAEGKPISDLDTQMRLLQAQMEEYKRLKSKSESGDNVEMVSGRVSDNNLDNVKEQKDESYGESIIVKIPIAEQTKPKVEDKKKRSSEKYAGDSSDDDDIVQSVYARSRGKRRRGRRDSAPTEDLTDDSNVRMTSETDMSCPISTQESHDKAPTEQCDVPPDFSAEDTSTPPTKKTPKNADKRRCIGRKPLTDFIVGNSYVGTVKYIKPNLGVFLDIGSHSDAFCHISCISDEFVSNITDVLKIDDIVQNARVVEVDRAKKRITVSLRSDETRENELAMLKFRRQYENNCAKKRDRQKNGEGDSKRKSAKNETATTDRSIESNLDTAKSGEPNRGGIVSGGQNIMSAGGSPEIRGQLQATNSDALSSTHRSAGVDLKRERKLARRAERRAAMQAANGNA